MEISSLINHLLGRQPEPRQEAVGQTETSRLKTGAVLAATVGSLTELTQAQRQTLITQLHQTLSQLQNPTGQQYKAEAGNPPPIPLTLSPARLAEAVLARLELLTSARVLLADIRLLNASYLVYTNRSLAAGQQVQVQVRPDGQLQLLGAPIANPAGSPNAQAQKPLAGPEAGQQIAQGLRQSLPQSQPLVDLFRTATKILAASQLVAPPDRAKLLPEPILKMLTQLEQRAMPLDKLQSPEAVKYILKHSGQFLESNLAAIARNNTLSLPTGTAPRSAPPATPPASLPTREVAENPSLNQILGKDRKALLLALLKELNQAALPGPAMENPSRPRTATDLFSIFSLLFSRLGSGFQAGSEPLPNQQQLVAHLKAQVVSAIARIQTHQLQQLSQVNVDSVASATGGLLEIPVKIQENIFPLFIHIQEKPVKEKPEEEDRQHKKTDSRKKRRHWHVFMEFDLDEMGWFATEISAHDNKVKTLFWAEHRRTRDGARQRLEELKAKLCASGVDVEELRCLDGDPPARNSSIRQTLVDITT